MANTFSNLVGVEGPMPQVAIKGFPTAIGAGPQTDTIGQIGGFVIGGNGRLIIKHASPLVSMVPTGGGGGGVAGGTVGYSG